MTGNWEVCLWDDGELTLDGGKVIYLHLSHFMTGVMIAGFAIRYEDEMFVDTIARNDLSLPSAVTRRLLMKVTNQYVNRVQDECPSGVVSFVVLTDFIDDVYDLSDAAKVTNLFRSSFLTFIGGDSVTQHQIKDSVDTMQQTSTLNAGPAPISYWWQIEIMRQPYAPPDEPQFVVVLGRHHRIGRDLLRHAHRQNPTSDLSDLLRGLMQSQRIMAIVGGTNLDDPVVQRIERNDFGLADADVTAIAMIAFRRLAPSLLPTEQGSSEVIQIDLWLREYLAPVTAARLQDALRYVPPSPKQENERA